MADSTNRNTAVQLLDQLNHVDLTDGNINNIEAGLYLALKNLGSTPKYSPDPIAPLAEPLNLNDLVGPSFTQSYNILQSQANRVDNAYQAVSELNNLIKSSLDTIEKNISNAVNSIQTVKNRLRDASSYYWITESFNNTSNIDTQRSTAFVDTDFGDVRLVPANSESIGNFTLTVQQDQLSPNTLPGANLYIQSVTNNSTTSDPSVTLITENTYDLGNILDGDPHTKFECERNFIQKNQNLLLLGRSYYADPSGKLLDVSVVTKDLDFTLVVNWPNSGVVNTGVKQRLAEYVDTFPSNDLGKVVFSFNVVFDSPTIFSTLNLAPFSRDGADISVDSIIAQTEDGQYFTLAKNISLFTGNTFNTLQTTINSKTGTQSVGTIFYNPSNKPIVSINIKLSSLPLQSTTLLSHPFSDEYVQQHTVRHYLLFSSADNSYWWKRLPVNSTPVQIQSQSTNPKLFGSTATSILSTLLTAGQASKVIIIANPGASGSVIGKAVGGAAGSIAGQAQTLQGQSNITKLLGSAGGTLGVVGGFLAKAVPYVGAAMLLSDIISGFGADTTRTVLKVDNGYDVFKGWRSSLGLTELAISREQYSGSGEIYSTLRQFLVPCSRIALYVEENIPQAWGPGQWLQYFISVDGSNWIPIDKASGSDFSKAVVLDTPTQNIYFKAILTSNSGDTYKSPILNHYTLQGLP